MEEPKIDIQKALRDLQEQARRATDSSIVTVMAGSGITEIMANAKNADGTRSFPEVVAGEPYMGPVADFRIPERQTSQGE